MNQCSVCDRTDIKARGLCTRHYSRWRYLVSQGRPVPFPVRDARQVFNYPWCVCGGIQQEITLFGWLIADGVTQCSRCGRPPRKDPTP